jgi:tetratricopeptide (TPR) repeat protein
MAIPKKKRRTIVVDDQTYYWRKASNIELYIETGERYNYVIKAFFTDGYEFRYPSIVRAVIEYARANWKAPYGTFRIEEASEIFKKELLASAEKENQLAKERNQQFRERMTWECLDQAKECIQKNELTKAMTLLSSSIGYDKDNTKSQHLLNTIISSANKTPSLYNHRACIYRYKKEYKKALKDIQQALILDSEFAIAYGTKAEIMYDLGDMEEFFVNYELSLKKGMTQRIDQHIHYALRENERLLGILRKYNRSLYPNR